jgi:hypothetical protein
MNCRTKQCRLQPKSRGLCPACYGIVLKKVNCGIMSWDDLCDTSALITAAQYAKEYSRCKSIAEGKSVSTPLEKKIAEKYIDECDFNEHRVAISMSKAGKAKSVHLAFLQNRRKELEEKIRLAKKQQPEKPHD